MSAPPMFDGLSEVRGTLAADLGGQLTGPIAGAAGLTREHASATAVGIAELVTAAELAGLGKLELVLTSSPRQLVVTAVRSDAFTMVAVDPSKGASRVEKALRSWTPSPAPAAPPPVPAAAPARDPWAALRRALVRGQLAEAAAAVRQIGEAPAAPAGRAGAEPLEPAERERAVNALLSGSELALSGDVVGGARQLQELTRPTLPNLSLRWLAHHGIARAALQGGSLDVARQNVKEALTLARRLDEDARAVTQWTAGELLSMSQDPSQGLPWLLEARNAFGRLGDGWGLARAWLVEARIHASSNDDERCTAAARQALDADAAWEEPAVFLARRALSRGDVAGAERLLPPRGRPAADRVRALLDAVRAGKVAQAEVTELLREQDAPPTTRALHALERIANASPAFAQAREALAWALLRRGKYAEASVIFRALLSQQLAPAESASVEAGLSCVSRAMPPERPPVLTRTPPPVAPSAGPGPSPTLTPTPRPGTVFSGQLSVFALPDLLEFLRAGKRSGLLTCSSAAGMGSLRFRAGRITGASSPAARSLGQLLLEARQVTPLTLRAAAPGDDDSDDVLGERLVREGSVPAGAVEDALRRGIELTMRELVGWKDGEFAFEETDPAPAARPAVELDPQGLLLNLFKELDESSRSLPLARER